MALDRLFVVSDAGLASVELTWKDCVQKIRRTCEITMRLIPKVAPAGMNRCQVIAS